MFKPNPDCGKTRFEGYCAGARVQHGERFTPPTDKRWIDAYNKGDRFRVQVKFHGTNDVLWGFVSLTTGWSPSFLLMLRRGQVGSIHLLCSRDEIVATKWIK